MNAVLQAGTPALERPRFYCDPRWVEAFAGTYDLDLQWCVVHRGTELKAALPLLTRRRFGMRFATTPLMMMYNPVWFAPSDDLPNRVLRERLESSGAIARVLQKHFHRIDIALGPELTDVRGFSWAGLRLDPHYTYVIDITRPLALHGSKKKALQKAKQESYTLHEERDLDAYIEMHKLTMGRHGRGAVVADILQKRLITRLLDAGLARQFVVKADGKPVHSRIWLQDDTYKIAYAWQGVSDPAWLPRGVYTWATVELMKRFAGDGYTHLDMGGANMDSIAQFKAGFGGDLVLHFRARKPLPGAIGWLRGLLP